ncbi:hypothetical protein ACWDAZ_36135, partial [Streptomyces sp. NPDC001215]
MAPNGTSNLHDDAYQTDTYTEAGPAGHDLSVRTRLQGGLCGSVTFDSRGRLVTVCMAPGRAPRLMLLNPDNLSTIAGLELPGTAGTSPTDVTGGGYFYLDNDDRVVVPTKAGGRRGRPHPKGSPAGVTAGRTGSLLVEQARHRA